MSRVWRSAFLALLTVGVVGTAAWLVFFSPVLGVRDDRRWWATSASPPSRSSRRRGVADGKPLATVDLDEVEGRIGRIRQVESVAVEPRLAGHPADRDRGARAGGGGAGRAQVRAHGPARRGDRDQGRRAPGRFPCCGWTARGAGRPGDRRGADRHRRAAARIWPGGSRRCSRPPPRPSRCVSRTAARSCGAAGTVRRTRRGSSLRCCNARPTPMT